MTPEKQHEIRRLLSNAAGRLFTTKLNIGYNNGEAILYLQIAMDKIEEVLKIIGEDDGTNT